MSRHAGSPDSGITAGDPAGVLSPGVTPEAASALTGGRAMRRLPARKSALGVVLAIVAVAGRFVLVILHFSSGGYADTCATKGISTPAGNEGICVRGNSLFGGRTTFNVVDAGHTLQMPGYDANLLASGLTTTTVFGPALNSTDYPNDEGLLASLELSVTNTGSSPLEFDQTAADVDLLIPPNNDPAAEFARPQVPYPEGAPSPQLDQEGAIPPGGTSSGWVSFVVPLWAKSRLNTRPADLEFYRPGHEHQRYVGQIRLWKAATAAGQAAIAFRQTAPTTATTTN